MSQLCRCDAVIAGWLLSVTLPFCLLYMSQVSRHSPFHFLLFCHWPVTQVPEALEFGLAAVKGQICRTLRVQNSGDSEVQCSWEIGQPFSISPDVASINAGQSAVFECRFKPAEASVYTVVAACHADTGYIATVKVNQNTLLFLKCNLLAAAFPD